MMELLHMEMCIYIYIYIYIYNIVVSVTLGFMLYAFVRQNKVFQEKKKTD